jgi:mono/diheme cytochrome c family protein
MIRIAFLLGLLGLASPVSADQIATGREMAAENCAACHQIGTEGDSPLAAAPPFRHLARRYPIADLEEALVEGIMTAHADMPVFSFDSSDAAALIAYLQSIQEE